MKLLGSTKCKIAKNENGENRLYLKITEVVLVQLWTKIINMIEVYMYNMSLVYICS